jgi:hypothetical protein
MATLVEFLLPAAHVGLIDVVSFHQLDVDLRALYSVVRKSQCALINKQ